MPIPYLAPLYDVGLVIKKLTKSKREFWTESDCTHTYVLVMKCVLATLQSANAYGRVLCQFDFCCRCLSTCCVCNAWMGLGFAICGRKSYINSAWVSSCHSASYTASWHMHRRVEKPKSHETKVNSPPYQTAMTRYPFSRYNCGSGGGIFGEMITNDFGFGYQAFLRNQRTPTRLN